MGCKMELHICHMYPELLNMYGDIGNVKILKRRAENRGIAVHVHAHNAGDTFEDELYDIVMLGGGQDFEVQIVLDDLAGEKKEKLQRYIENGGIFLGIGSGYQLLGRSYVTSEGERVSGLDILPFETKPGEKRFVGNAAVEINGIPSVGFENHGGRTYIGDLKPLGRVISGFGNNGEDGGEGLVYQNTFCTYLHGPFLSKNPEFADALLLKALEKRYEVEALAPLDDTYEHKAREVILAKLEA